MFNNNVHFVLQCRARKLLNLRIFENPENQKSWDKSVSDLGLEILCVSQVCVDKGLKLATVICQ